MPGAHDAADAIPDADERSLGQHGGCWTVTLLANPALIRPDPTVPNMADKKHGSGG